MAAVCLGIACGGESVDPETRQLVPGSWSRGWPQLRHDGKPVESEHFIVFSEASSADARAEMAGLAESVLAEITDQLGLVDGQLEFLPSYGSDKIHIMADYGQMAQSGLAYRDGIIIRALDSPRWVAAGHTPASFRRLMHHELTHVIEFLLIGNPAFQQANTVWMREGFASFNAGPFPSSITTVSQLNAWREKMESVPGGGNPIGIRVWSDFPPEVLQPNTTIQYYPFFELAAGYVMSADGLGGTAEDLKGFYDDLGAGRGYRRAFQERFGLDLDAFEANFWDWMTAYLSER